MQQLSAALGEPRPRFWRLLLSGLLFTFALQSLNREAVTSAFLKLLEFYIPATAIGDAGSITGIVVLGGGEERLREAGRLARNHGHLRVFVSGAGEVDDIRHQVGRDIAPNRIESEGLSRSTFENAVFSKAEVRPRPGERWLLVTSAAHMPRAIGVFRGVGFDVEPWPVHDLPKEDDRVASVVQHEALGLLWYRLLGRTDTFFPGP